jgi:molybdenum cofactor synthesis domain-containing protein
VIQGGSTITQQLVKLTRLENATSAKARAAATADTKARKLEELRYAIWVENHLSKNSILEHYLNTAYYGDGAYGIQAAAHHYFSTTAAKLNLTQSAMLAGLVRSPAGYDPTNHPKAAMNRRNTVLDRMQALHVITRKQSRHARATPLGLKVSYIPNGCISTKAPWFCDYLLNYLLQDPDLGKTVEERKHLVYAGGLTIKTTLRPSFQLAAVGRDAVAVRPAPRVAVLSTGTELVPLGREPGYGQIHDSNGYGLTAAARELGALASYGGIVPDDPSAVRNALEDAAASADLVLTSGGVSAGTRDTVKEVLAALGTVRFDKVAMQPGMPQGFGAVGGTPVFTLPGNPVSSMVSFEVFVRPALLAMLGEPAWERPRVRALAGAGWSSPAGRRQYVRATLSEADGRRAVTPVGAQGSHLAADLAVATCLAVVPEEVTRVEPGDELDCDLLASGPVPGGPR